MEWIQVVALALIQGLSEFLPISSSAHLILPAQLLGWTDQGLAFDVAVHVGSLLAVLTYFREDVTAIVIAWFDSLATRQQSHESLLAWYLIIGTIPAGLAGLLFNDFIEANFRSMAVIATTTVVFGLALAWADRKGGGGKTMESFSWKSALLVGVAQALALIPGTSRSGITMTAALALGFNRFTAARFSFLLAIPVITLSGGYKSLELLGAGQVDWTPIAVATILSGITAYACIHGFLRLVERIGMMPFVIYRMLLGAVLFYLVWS